jgi:hypothetical protein
MSELLVCWSAHMDRSIAEASLSGLSSANEQQLLVFEAAHVLSKDPTVSRLGSPVLGGTTGLRMATTHTQLQGVVSVGGASLKY